MFTHLCLIANPKIDDDYERIRSIGSGSQASVELYKRKSKEQVQSSKIIMRADKEGYGEELYAVKVYSETLKRENYLKEQPAFRFDNIVLNEIAITRELRICSNII